MSIGSKDAFGTLTNNAASTSYTAPVQTVVIALTSSLATPGVPTNFALVNETSSSITVSWTAPTGVAATSYDVEYRVTGTVSWTTLTGITSLFETITGLSANTFYDVRVCAVNGAGAGPFTSTLSASTTGQIDDGPIPNFPILPEGFPVKVSPGLDTLIGTTKSLRELRYPQRSYPIWDFEILFEELRDQTQNQTPYVPFVGYTEYMQFLQLWLMMYGQTNVFAFNAPWDNSRSNQTIGIGDGSSYIFTVYRQWGIAPNDIIEPVGVVESVTSVTVGGTTIPTSNYFTNRNKIIFQDSSGTHHPPTSGQAIAMTFNYSYLCKFSEDEQNTEEFNKNRWTLPSLKFQSVIWP